ncbi:uncharacterized protein EI97DRAFT_410237 [Westerdykella ornata]|uniref:Ribosomal RNA-processing protein 43 n=1 Tax=Westerdykella ornata TaxID=318751 RepID=A0A6A6JXR0_WESOR|nr:uncharacterized protein EI97DRAFT_410237 [Westerdykella ornata]KAF2281410.1 hypothetical protein EI97DRAFT_410237 [Westerdykella ornata]
MAAATTAAKRPAPSNSDPQSQTTATPAPLSFPRPIFAALSPHPFLRAHLTSTAPVADRKSGAKGASKRQGIRANGRTPSESRTPQVHTGSLTHCNGSTVVRLGNTVAVCGVRAEILKAEADVEVTEKVDEDEDGGDDDDAEEELRALGLLVPNFEISTGSTPLLLPGNAPSAFAQTLTARVRNLLLATKVVRMRDLRILYTPSIDEEGVGGTRRKVVKGYWTLYIDTLFVSLDGCAFDAAWLAILAALRDTRLPRAYFDEEFEDILCDDDPAQARRLRLRGLPVPSSFAVFEAGETGDEDDDEEGADKMWILSDPDAFEEQVCREAVCVVVDLDRRTGGRGMVVRKIEKSGGGVVGRREMRGLVEMAWERWKVWREVLGA